MERILDEEKNEVKKAILEEFGQDRYMEVDKDLDNLVRINNRLIEAAESWDRKDPIGSYHTIKRAEKKKESIETELVDDIKQLSDSGRLEGNTVLQKIRKLQSTLDQAEEDVVEEAREEAVSHAEEVIESRPTFVFESDALQKFLRQVKREQVDSGNECWGWFIYDEREESYLLKRYVPMKTKEATRTSVTADEKTKEMIRKKGNGQNILHGHSHPPGKIGIDAYGTWSHSGNDKGVIMGEKNFNLEGFNGHAGVIARPRPNGKQFWIIAQIWDNYGEFMNCPVKVKGNTPSLVSTYNKAIVKALLNEDEEKWIKYVEGIN